MGGLSINGSPSKVLGTGVSCPKMLTIVCEAREFVMDGSVGDSPPRPPTPHNHTCEKTGCEGRLWPCAPSARAEPASASPALRRDGGECDVWRTESPCLVVGRASSLFPTSTLLPNSLGQRMFAEKRLRRGPLIFNPQKQKDCDHQTIFSSPQTFSSH